MKDTACDRWDVLDSTTACNVLYSTIFLSDVYTHYVIVLQCTSSPRDRVNMIV
jgi:hypothetical protein